MDRFLQFKQENFYYNPKLKHRAAKLRQRLTSPEYHLWDKVLIARKMLGYRFMRQVPVLYYIPDFMCKELALIIEVDGPYHKYQKDRDTRRQHRLEGCGFTVLRFSNREVLEQTAKVKSVIETWIKQHESRL